MCYYPTNLLQRLWKDKGMGNFSNKDDKEVLGDNHRERERESFYQKEVAGN